MPQPFKFSPLTLGILKYLLRKGTKHFNGRAKNVVFHAGFIYKAIYNYTLPCRSNILIYLCILFPAVFMSTSACKTDYRNSKQARIVFNETLHDFATIALNTKITHHFTITNPGKERLIIQDVKTSCGCTVPQWPREPIKKGDKKDINIVFEADFPGAFHKTIYVYYNGEGSPDTLFIKGKTQQPRNN